MTSQAILVVDDQPVNLELIADFLEVEKYDLDFVDSGEAALAKILGEGKKRYDLVLLDRMMPGINGIEVLKKIRADPNLSTIPVIMQTAAASPSEVKEGLDEGAWYYLTKPFDPRTLRALVKAALRDTADVAGERDSEAAHALVFSLLDTGRYRFQSPLEARALAKLLATRTANQERGALGLTELLINAIEHGNLGITYQEKKQLLESGAWEGEIERRLQYPGSAKKWATIAMDCSDTTIRFTIEDQGDGFDWASYMEIDPARAYDPNGRGIALARTMGFDGITYMGKGNIVVATASLRPKEGTSDPLNI